MNKLPLHEPCPCGSGKEYGQCCGRVNGFQLLYFHRGKRSHYGALIEKCIGDLLKYAKRYFVNWDVKARAKFLAASQAQEVTQQFIPVFWEWYVVDYRPFKDVSPLIDFYLAENEDAITQQEKSLYTSLKNSHLSIYQVLWVQTNTVAIRDIFTNEESILERDFGSVTRLVEEGSLLLSRIIIINGVPIITGNPVFVYSEQKGYLYEEINSIRIYEKEDDIQAFLREQGHTICSFVMDLLNGIKKNQVKTRSFRLNEIDRKNVIEQIFHNSFFCLIDPNEPLLKFTWNQEEDRFKRLYLERNLLIVSAEDSEDLCLAINELSNMLGYKWDNGEMEDVWIYGVVTEDEEQTEEIQTEILFDRHLEEWLTLPHPALEDLTPVEALQDIRGRVLLEGMLNDLEIMEIRAGSRGEYYYPTSVIRNKLGVEKNKPYKELLRPEAIALKVEKHRAQQRLSPYITSYNWLNDGYVQVAIVIFDRFFSQHGNEERLAWLLYMWNEFTTVYYPCVSRLTYWIEALERTFSDQPEKNYDDGNVAREFGLSTLIVSKNAYLIAGHFQRFPLDFNLAVQEYPMWADLNFHRMIQTYDEIVQYMNAYAYMMEDQWNEREQEVYCAYYDQVNQYAYFWDDFRKKVYRAFFRDHFLLDDGHTEGNSVANQLWEKQASRFPPYLREAALQMMMSFVGIYRIFPFKNKELVFVDYFTGEHHKIVGHFGDDIHDYVVPGMIILCRLLPLTGGWMWINEPFFVVLEELEPLFEKN
ncbi:MAG: SEC-C domain-containing protein, partial [Bacillota bacterium]|nr:SEC-C domain-containing protein [Bacillota bacterium]